ncbi:Nsp1-like C-terminal region-domain-containing protein [Nemania sp. FL0916]|nr:Nsp1-like C-terminal region-domain-containing protein [Nemania sp. FL0916]
MSLFGTPSSSGPFKSNSTTSTAPASGGLFGSSTPAATASSGGLFGNQNNQSNQSNQAKTGTPTFSFLGPASGSNSAAPASSGAASPSLFGSVGAKPAEQKPLFGATNSTTTGASSPSLGGGTGGFSFGPSSSTPSSNNMFGSKPAAASAGTGSGLFGGASSTPNTTTAAAPGTAAESQTGSANKPGGLFGGGGGGSGAAGGSPFGTISSSNAPATQATPAKPTSLFALNSTTPAGAPPANNSKPSSGFGGMFPSVQPQQGGKGEAQTTSLFANQASSQSNSSATQPAPSPFASTGQPQKPATSMFSAPKPAESPSLSMFSTKPAATEGAGAAGGSSSSSGPSLFGQQGQSKPVEATATAVAGASSAKPSLFGNVASSTPSTTSPFLTATSTAQTPSSSAPASAPAKPISLFGNQAKPTASTTTAEPSKLGFGQPAASTATTEVPKPTASLFGAAPTSTTAPTTTGAAPAASTPALGSAPTPTTTAAASTAAPAAASLFGSKPAASTMSGDSSAQKPAAAPASSLGASTTGPTSSMARLKNKTMDEILNRWATDLSKYQKEFKEQASQVAAWDRLLVDNGEKIQNLYVSTFEAEKASREVERHLVTVESQQEELESWLDKYEAEVDTLFSKQFGSGEQLAGPDQERERTYKLAEKITERLDEMGRDLTNMIKEINDISGTVSKGSKPDDPLSQIVRVLNGHLTQLQWIDTNAAALQAKVAAAQKASSQIGSQYGGPEQDNVDSFYRSYMGRR